MNYKITDINWGTVWNGTEYKYYAELHEIGTNELCIMATLDCILNTIKDRKLNVVNLKHAKKIFKSRPIETKWLGYPQVQELQNTRTRALQRIQSKTAA